MTLRMRFALSVACAALTTCSAIASGAAPVAAGQPATTIGPAPPATRLPLDPDEARENRVDLEHRYETEFFRNLAGGPIDAERMRRMWEQSKAVPSESPAGAQALNTWQLVGPTFSVNPGGGFMTGRVRDIDPVNIRALAASGGLWRFDIFGGIPMSDNVPASWFGSFATSPLDANTILLGTGEYGQGNGTGLYRTTDGGANWTKALMIPTPAQFTKVRWSQDGATAYASTEQGFYRSTDGGMNWARTLTGIISDLSLVAGVPGLVFATRPGVGVFQSTDNGVTWSQLTTGGVPLGVAGNGAVSAVNFPLGGGVWIYVAFDTRIWRSMNGGISWTEVTPTTFGIGNSGYGPVLSANPNDPQIVLYGNVPYCRSTNGGGSWSKIATPHLHADYHMFAWDPDAVGVWAANDGGWFHSTDQGATWSSSSNVMPISQFYSIDCLKNEVGYMIGGTQDNNVLYTPNQSLDWVDPAVGSSEGDASGAVIDQFNPQQMWAISGVVSAPIGWPRYRTTNGGTTWNEIDNGIDPIGSAGSIRIDNAFNPVVFTSMGPFVYESADGVNWSKTNATAFVANVTSLTASTRVAGGAVLYATMPGSTMGQRLFVRDNGTWVERSGGLPAGSVVKVVPHPWSGNYADEAWAILSTGFGSKIYHTLDRGVTWADITGDLPNSIPVSDLVPNPQHTGELYLGTLIGCYRSKNGGVNWEHWTNGMPQGAIITEMKYIDLTASTGQFFVVAATYGRSVWKRDVSGEDVFPILEVSNPFVQEGDAGTDTMWFRAHLPAAQTTSVSVDYATQDSTATAGIDYVSTSGTISFAPGATDVWLPVVVNGDHDVELDETFKLVFSNPLRLGLAGPAVGTIEDDDARGLVCRDLPVTDGTVEAIAIDGSTMYVGGSFQRVGPATGCGVPLSAATGQPLSLPKVDGFLSAVASDGSGGWYLGGLFHHVQGAPRTNLAHVLADGTLSPWNPVADDYVAALLVDGATVYAGGRFTTIDGVQRHNLAAIDATTGLPMTWAPEPNDQVLALARSGSTIYAGGSFTSIGGQQRNRIAALNGAGQAVPSWNPGGVGADAAVSQLMLDGGLLYAAGDFTSIGGQTRNHLATLDPTGPGAVTAWDPAPDNYVFALAADAGAIYAGGIFANIDGQARAGVAAFDRITGHATGWSPNPDGGVNAIAPSGGTVYVGGSFANIGGAARNNLAALSASTGNATSWNPDPGSTVSALGVSGGVVFAGGSFKTLAPQPRSSLAAFDVNAGQLLGWNPGADGTVLTLAASGGVVYAGGTFANVGGQPRNFIAALDGATGQATGWDPNANGAVRTLLLLGTRIGVGGSFTTIGGQTRNRVAALFTSSGAATTWNPNANSMVLSLVTDGTQIYAGGSFTSIGGLARNGLAALNGTNGAANPTWNPNPNGPVNLLLLNGPALYIAGSFTQIAGVSRARLAVIDLSSQTLASWAPAPNNLVRAIIPSGAEVYVAGDFTVIGGQRRNHLALLRPATNQVSTWAPEPDGIVNALALSGSTLYAGGAFNVMGGMPQSHLACLIPLNLVDVPAPAPVADLGLRLSPNPTSSRVRIEYVLPEAARVTISVYDVQGRRVGARLDAWQGAGAHETTWDRASARSISPGIYFVRFEAGAHALVRRLVLL